MHDISLLKYSVIVLHELRSCLQRGGGGGGGGVGIPGIRITMTLLIFPVWTCLLSKTIVESVFYIILMCSGVVQKLEEYYSQFTSNLKTEFSIPSEHAMVSQK